MSNSVLQPREEWAEGQRQTVDSQIGSQRFVSDSAGYDARFFQSGGSLYGGEAPRGGFAFNVRRDWGSVASGALLILTGAIFLLWPNGSLVTLTIIAGAAFIISGAFGFVTSYRLSGGSILRPWAVTYGILDVLIGLLLVVFPSLFSVVLPWLIGLALLVFGIFEIASSFTVRRMGVPLWPIVLGSGIVGVLCGILLFALPGSILVFMGIYLAVRGVMLVCNGLRKGSAY